METEIVRHLVVQIALDWSKQWTAGGDIEPYVEQSKKCQVSGQGARSGTIFTRSSEPASWIA